MSTLETTNPAGSFLSALEQPPRESGRIRPWQRTEQTPETPCAYCGKPCGESRTIGQLIPIALGAGPVTPNLVNLCLVCRRKQGQRDWISLDNKADSPALDAARIGALKVAPNHRTRMRLPISEITRALAKRWKHPRGALVACCLETAGFFGWPAAVADAIPPHLLTLLIESGAGMVNGRGNAWGVPRARFLDVAWKLIEAGAWLRRIDIPGHPDATPMDDADAARWWETSRSVNALVRACRLSPQPRKPNGEGRRSRRTRREFGAWKRWLVIFPAGTATRPEPMKSMPLSEVYRQHLIGQAASQLMREARGESMPFIVKQKPRRKVTPAERRAPRSAAIVAR